MQRVSSLLPSWERTKAAASHTRSISTLGLERVLGWSEKTPGAGGEAGGSTPQSPVNRSSSVQSIRREAFWPAPLDRETERAAAILKSFTIDGFLAPEAGQPTPPPSAGLSPTLGPSGSATSMPGPKNQVLWRIPTRVIQNAAGLAVFTCVRSGLWMAGSGSGGSGILVARKADGTWSSPVAILLQTESMGFILGVDIYDGVLVINDLAALDIFMRPKLTLGQDIDMAAGPLAFVGMVEADVRWRPLDNSVVSYMKSRGTFANVRLDGSLVAERPSENEKFYETDITVMDILSGGASRDTLEIRLLNEVAKAAEGRLDYDEAAVEHLATQIVPGDALVESPRTSPTSPKPFGIPDSGDPDPFGVLALEMAGLDIRESGTRLRPASSQFEYHPSPTSPIHSKFSMNGMGGVANYNRQSVESAARNSNRGSYMSGRTEASKMTDAFTQTDVGKSNGNGSGPSSTPHTSPSPSASVDGRSLAGGAGHERKRSFDRIAYGGTTGRRSPLSNYAPEGKTVVEEEDVAREPEEVDYTKIDLTPLRRIHERSGSLDGTTMTAETTDDGRLLRAFNPSADYNNSYQAGMTTDDASRASSRYTGGAGHDDASSHHEGGNRGRSGRTNADGTGRDRERDEDADDEDSDLDDLDDEPVVVYEVASAAPAPGSSASALPVATVIQAKGAALVTIPRRIAPPLPPRNPARASGASAVGQSDIDLSAIPSPTAYTFGEDEEAAAGGELSKTATESTDKTPTHNQHVGQTEGVLTLPPPPFGDGPESRRPSSVYGTPEEAENEGSAADGAAPALPPRLPSRPHPAVEADNEAAEALVLDGASNNAAGGADALQRRLADYEAEMERLELARHGMPAMPKANHAPIETAVAPQTAPGDIATPPASPDAAAAPKQQHSPHVPGVVQLLTPPTPDRTEQTTSGRGEDQTRVPHNRSPERWEEIRV